jgi:Zn-dependent protease with chaperone function
MASPDRALATVVLTAAALAGFLALVVAEVVVFSVGSPGLSARTVRCLVSPLSSLDTVVHASAVAFTTLAFLPLMVGLRAARRMHQCIARLRHATMTAKLGSSAPVLAAAAAAGVAGRVDVVHAVAPMAFSYGWVRPRICVSTGLVGRLTGPELEAVLLHEAWHVSQRDPLRLLVAQTIGTTFGAVPEIRRLVRLHALTTEVAADRHVVRAMGQTQPLAGALMKVAEPATGTPRLADTLENRVSALVGPVPDAPRWRGRVAAAAIACELCALLPLLGGTSLLSVTGLAAHPLC